jgi:hypothetical protein
MNESLPLKAEPVELKQEIKEENAEMEISVMETQNMLLRLTQTGSRREVFDQLQNPLPEDKVRNYKWYRRVAAAEETVIAEAAVTVCDQESRRVSWLKIVPRQDCSEKELSLLITHLAPVLAKLRSVLVYSHVSNPLIAAYRSSGFLNVTSLIRDEKSHSIV